MICRVSAVLGLLFAWTITLGCSSTWNYTYTNKPDGPTQKTTPVKKSSGAFSGSLAVFPVTVDRHLKKYAEPGKMHETWRSLLDDQPGVRPVQRKKVSKAVKEEAKGTYKYWTLMGAHRVYLHIGTRTEWKKETTSGKIVRATFLYYTAQAGADRNNLTRITMMGKAVGFNGKIWPDSTLPKKIEGELRQFAQKVLKEMN